MMGTSFATNYKWKDANGQIHYGQNPPAGVQAEKLKTAPKSSSTAQQEIDDFKAKQEAETQAEKKKVLAEKRRAQKLEQKRIWKANCNAAKTKLTSLLEKPRVRKRDAYGQLSIMPEKELKRRVQDAREEVELYCNPPKPETEGEAVQQ